MKLLASTRRAIAKGISKMECYHDNIPFDTFDTILHDQGLRMVNEDGTPFSAICCGREGTALIPIAADIENSVVTAAEIANNSLYITWYKMPVSGRYEIVAYLT